MKMKMKTTLLTIAMLTVTGNITAMNQGPMGMMGSVTTELLPSKTRQSEAAALLKINKDGVVSLNVNNDRALELPADFIEFMQNTLSVARTMTSQEGEKIEKLHMAYMEIGCPYWRTELTEVMGNNREFINALAQYDKDQNTYQMGWMTLRQEVDENSTTANPREELNKLIPLDRSLKKQLEKLQKMFKDANKDLERHIEKVEYLVRQNVQWMIAFGIAINPDFAKTVTAETTDHLTKTLTKLHTSPKVAALQKMQAEATKK